VGFHGVRGSTPCNGDDIARYGGNTSCVSVTAPGEEPLLFDMGTGARYFGLHQKLDGTFRGACLLSHLHWDHIQGLPFFPPVLCAGSVLDIYGPRQPDGRSLSEVFHQLVQSPVFPVKLDQLPGTLRFHDVGEETFDVGGFHVTARLVPHIGPTFGYRVEIGGRVITYISDHQQPMDGGHHMPPAALELAEGADLLIHDAQYLPEEFPRKSAWGHCTPEFALWLASKARVKRLALFHHDPMRDDDAVDEILRCATSVGEHIGVEVLAASEGLTVDLS
jgi:phosphoribosyl 1,2-cyclic phosphodiesterase